MIDIYRLEKKARQIRGQLVETSHKCHVPHLGGCLSCVDILVALYWQILKIDPEEPNKQGSDKFILSKGHAAHALFTTLAYKGFFDRQLLDNYGGLDNPLGEHPLPNCVSGVEIATGSLGHGLSFALGMALAAKLKQQSQKFFVLMGDGEINEGSVWEAALFAPMHQLDNVIAIIDYNKWQATGRSAEVMSLESITEKWQAFGWEAMAVDGHNMEQLLLTLKAAKKVKGKPIAIIADTVKGKGISFMQDDNNWHYRIPTNDEVMTAKKELGLIK
ncbi:MAG: transketolase [gamma proteobacterium symbiont of Taylorina sp.]|nr:transketolase [gamma proteobacterium symbiont of Taylorina sp.]